MLIGNPLFLAGKRGRDEPQVRGAKMPDVSRPVGPFFSSDRGGCTEASDVTLRKELHEWGCTDLR